MPRRRHGPGQNRGIGERVREFARRLILASTIAILAAGCSSGAATPTPAPTSPRTPTPTPAATLAAVTTADLGRGMNIGNTLEALRNNGGVPHTTSQETFYGNPAINQTFLNAIAAKGFKSVR